MNKNLISALTVEYEAVYLIDLETGTFEVLKNMKGSSAMVSSTKWNEACETFAKECSEHTRPLIQMLADIEVIKAYLAQTDLKECTFRHTASDGQWRKATLQVLEREKTTPSLILMTIVLIDKLTAQREKTLRNMLSPEYSPEKNAENNNQHHTPMYNMFYQGEIGNSEHKLFDHMNILLVDDSYVLRAIAKEILVSEGAVVTGAANGYEAINFITHGKTYDFIIMDIVMPHPDGVETTKQILQYQKEHGITTPIIGLTADDNEEQKQKIIEAGAFACLSKPLNPLEMSKVLITYMNKKSILLEEKMAEIKLMANTDMLTQAWNIVAYTHDLNMLSGKLKDKQTKAAIVICDLDNLKGINDRFGHDVGDIYIKNCCHLIVSVFSNSPLYRIGGDEFALIVQGDDLNTIEEKAGKLSKVSEILSAIEDVVAGKASVSVGYAFYDESIDDSIKETMKRADIAMYENKQMHKKWTAAYARLS